MSTSKPEPSSQEPYRSRSAASASTTKTVPRPAVIARSLRRARGGGCEPGVPASPGRSPLRSDRARPASFPDMFIRYFLDIPLPFAAVERELLAQPEVWVPGLAREAESRGERLLAEVGFAVDDAHRLDKQVEIG